MRPTHSPGKSPTGKVVDLDGEELDDLIEAEQPAQPFAETEEVDLSGERAVRVTTPAPDPMRTGPGRSNPPPSEQVLPVRADSRTGPPLLGGAARQSSPLAQVRTDPIEESVPAITGPLRPTPTADLRKRGGSMSAAAAPAGGSVPTARGKKKSRSRPAVRKPRTRLDDRSDELVGSVLGSYRILSLIGEGGMGRVYLADHVKLGRKVALKLLRPEYAVKRDAVSRFFKEAQAVNKIRHENIVDITDFVELESGETFIIMELLEGDDLADIARKGQQPIPLHRAMEISLQVCDALEAAHRVGVIHRDLKPDNIFIINTATRKDFVKLLDFGVAKLLGESTESDGWQTAAGSVIGTPAYMSPEQASGIPVDARSDIYSLGAILYELFTGHPVFRAKSFGEYVIKHMNDDPVPPRDLADAPRIPVALERVILRCLEKDPNRRYSNVAELREDLARATATVQTMVDTIALAPRPHQRRRRRALIAVPVGLLVVALAAAAFWLASGLSIEEVTKPSRDPFPASLGNSVSKEPGRAETEPLPPAKATTARLRLETEPQGAAVFRRGEKNSLGRTPLDLRPASIASEGTEVEFIFRLAGYEEAVERVTVTDNALYSIPLERIHSGVAGGKAKPPRRAVRKGKVRPPAIEEKKQPPPTEQPKVEPKTKRPGKVSPEDVVDPFSQ